MSDQLTRERSTTLLFYGCVLLLAYLMYLICAPFLRPMVWAGIIAVFFHPQYRKLERQLGKNRAATISTVFVALLIIVPSVLIVTAFVQQANETLGNLDMKTNSARIDRLKGAWSWIQLQGRGLGFRLGNFEDAIGKITTWAAGIAAEAAGSFLRNVIDVIFNMAISVFALFFFFRDGKRIIEWLRSILPFEAGFSEEQIAKTADLIRASISATLVVATIQGALGGIAFAALGLGAPIFWAVVMAFFALLPLGAGVVWLPVAIWLLATGSAGRGIALLIIGFGVIGLVDNFLRPIILSGRTQMNGLLVFVSLLGGIAAFGLLGIVLGPAIMAMATSFLNAYAAERQRSVDIREII